MAKFLLKGTITNDTPRLGMESIMTTSGLLVL